MLFPIACELQNYCRVAHDAFAQEAAPAPSTEEMTPETRMALATVLLHRPPESVEEADRVLAQHGTRPASAKPPADSGQK